MLVKYDAGSIEPNVGDPWIKAGFIWSSMIIKMTYIKLSKKNGNL